MKIDLRATDVNFMRLQLYLEDCKEREKSAKQVDAALAGHGYFDTAPDTDTPTDTPTEHHTETEDEMYDRLADMEEAKRWERMEQQAERDEAYIAGIVRTDPKSYIITDVTGLDPDAQQAMMTQLQRMAMNRKRG